MKVEIPDIEIRGFEAKKSKKTDDLYMVVRFEDKTGKPAEIIDRDMDRETYYKKGTTGKFIADLNIGKYTKFEVSDFIADKPLGKKK